MRTTISDDSYVKVRRRVKELEKRGFKKVSPIKEVYTNAKAPKWVNNKKEYKRGHYEDSRKFMCMMEGNKMKKETGFQQEMQEIADDLVQLLTKKNADYGNSFHEQYREYGLTSALIRLEDKLRRLKNLRNNENLVGESIEDSLKDLACYGMLTLHARERK